MDSASTDAASSGIRIAVENHNFNDVVVTVRNASGETRRLGTVGGNSRATFSFNGDVAAASQRLVLIAHPVGARSSYQSENFTLQRGQTVAWSLENGFARSTVAVY